MSRTQEYYEKSVNYRKELKAIWDAYETRIAQIERYKGSNGYAEDKKRAENERDNSINALQGIYRTAFFEIIRKMRESAYNQTMSAPSAEQLALLQALKMREKITRDELEQAARTLANSPVCLSVLDEIADKMEYHGVHFGGESTDSIIKHIDELADNANRICSLNKCNTKREMVEAYSNHTADGNALYSFKVDRDDISSASDAMEYYGSIRDVAAFEKAVNN
jgi:hypothetical protein